MLDRPHRILIATCAVTALVITGVSLLAPGRDEDLERLDAAPEDLAAVVGDFAGGISRGQEYRPPTTEQRRVGVRGLAALIEDHQPGGDAAGEFELDLLGFTVIDGVDSITGRPFTAVIDEHASEQSGSDRSWGMYVIDRSVPPALVVGVPHPTSDLRTEELGLDLFRRIPGSVLLIAGAHRHATEDADVAHQRSSLFHAISAELSGQGLGHVQLHGFHDGSLPGVDIVVSGGATGAGAGVRRVAARLDHDDWVICRAWSGQCTGLEGRTNVQGRAAAERGAMFVHLELSRSVREDVAARERVLSALAEAELVVP